MRNKMMYIKYFPLFALLHLEAKDKSKEKYACMHEYVMQ